MTSALAFGERISSFMLQDAVFLGIDPANLNSPPESRFDEKERRKAKTTTTTPPTPTEAANAIEKAQLTKVHLAIANTRAKRAHESPQASGNHDKTTYPPAPVVFRLLDLPTEIRDIIYEFIFLHRSGKRPKFLNAVEKNKVMHAEAFKVFCAVNNFTISLKGREILEAGKEKGVEKMEAEEMRLVRRITIAVPKDMQQATPFCSPLLTHAKIRDLTFSVSTPNSLRVAAYSVLPSFFHLHTLTIILRNAHRLPDRRKPDRIAHMNSFVEVLALVDRVVDVKGMKMSEGKIDKKDSGLAKTRQIWVWTAEKRGEAQSEGRRLVMNVPKKHIKFD